MWSCSPIQTHNNSNVSTKRVCSVMVMFWWSPKRCFQNDHQIDGLINAGQLLPLFFTAVWVQFVGVLTVFGGQNTTFCSLFSSQLPHHCSKPPTEAPTNAGLGKRRFSESAGMRRMCRLLTPNLSAPSRPCTMLAMYNARNWRTFLNARNSINLVCSNKNIDRYLSKKN